MAEKYGRVAGKWTKMNDSGFEEFDAKNPGLASGKPGKNADQVKLNYTINDDNYTCEYSVDGGEVNTAKYAFDGSVTQTIGKYTFTTTTSVQEREGGRMPGGQINVVYTGEDGKEIKQENYQFHGPNRMIVETFANDAAMVTVFEREE